MQYAFIFGKTPYLSLAEVIHVFHQDHQNIDYFSREFAILNFQKELKEIKKIQDKLGGTIKITQILSSISWQKNFTNSEKKSLLKSLMEICKKQDQHKSKFKFGINVYNYQKSAKQFLKEILIDFKHDLKKANITSRFINKDFQNISSAAAINENLLEQGLELNILFTSEKIYISQTISIQNINEYSKRDYEKPGKDALSGMLPPKLAQIMINLKTPEINTIFDPFCGSGTLLLEALLSDNHIIGSDSSEKAVSDSNRNIQWLKNNYKINPELKNQINTLDALKITDKNLPAENFAIITEPYLGPALKKEPNEKEIKEIQDQIKTLIFKFFQNISEILPQKTEIIIIFPYIRTKKKKHFLQIEKEIAKLGYEITHLIKEEIQKKLHLKINFPSLCYEREDQIIGREIWKFKKI